MEPEEFAKGVKRVEWRRYWLLLALFGLALMLWAFGNAEFNIWVALGVYVVLQIGVIVKVGQNLANRRQSWGDDSINRQTPDLEDGVRMAGGNAPLLTSLVLLYRTVRDTVRNKRNKDNPF